LEPLASANKPLDAIPERSSIAHSGKCDVVCLVTSVVQPSASTGNRARMTVWDGTTNGTYSVAAVFRQPVQVALDAPAVYDQAFAEQADEMDTQAQLMALYQKEVHPRRLLGSAVRVEAMSDAFNSHISRCKPGMWIRIRNLYAPSSAPQSVSSGCTVRGDSHICQLGADFLYVFLLTYSLCFIALFPLSSY
jgi:hypothetical protein